MKLFTKDVKCCEECPNVSYLHYDGEGESCPYEYDNPVCRVVPQAPQYRYDYNRYKYIRDKKSIPIWCPLTNK